MRYLVTGGLGFIGSNFVDKLIELGHEVVVVDDLSTGKIEYKNPKAQYYLVSITNYPLMEVLTKGIDCIFHFAAWARLMRSIDDPIGTNNANIVGTVTLLEAARKNKVPRFVFSSSSSVYGVQDIPQMKEDMKPNPGHPYALQKWAGEEYCKLYSKLFGITTISLRYFNVYGARQVIEGDYALVIGKFIRQKAEKGKMTVYGDGEQTRAYTHVSDVVEANLRASEYDVPQGTNDVFNIGVTTETSVNKIVELLGGEAEHIIPNPRGDFEERRKCAVITKALNLLHWEPKVTIEQGIAQLL